MHEIILENDKEIVLDATNNVFVGPEGRFKIVIDKVNGDTVEAWHVESKDGDKTPNLALRAKGKHIDLALGNANRTSGHFFTRNLSALYNEYANKYGVIAE